jgi:phosphoesterase RecJ-like protein
MEQTKAFKAQLVQATKVAIIAHFNPDGDAVGSSLAVYHWLAKLGKQSTVIMPNGYPEFLHWLPGHDKVVLFDKQKEQVQQLVKAADMIFCLDFNHLTRIQELGTEVDHAQGVKVMVDHHQSPGDFADFTFHDAQASSTAELIYDLILSSGYKELIDKDIATCIYTGIVTDTGSFQYSSTTAKVHRIAADLLEQGLDGYEIYDRIFNSFNENRLRFFGFCWNERMEILNGEAAIIGVSEKDQFKFNLRKGDTEGLVNTPLQIQGMRLAVFAKVQEQLVKLSFRSKGEVDVNKLAREHFNGGGHKNAAGGKMEVPLNEVLKKLREVIPKFLKS